MMVATRIRIIFAVLFLLAGCTYKDIPKAFFDCKSTTLAVTLVSKLDPTSCLAIDGSITVSATGGFTPYAFSINNGDYQSDGAFVNLGQGSYTLYAKDANNCEKWIQVDIKAPASTLDVTVATTSDNQCLTDNGSITLTGTGGTPPYTYQFGSGQAGTQNTFSNLKPGPYTFTIRDSAPPPSCIKTVNVVVKRGDTGASFATDIKPILDKSCAISGCHNGDNGGSRNWEVFTNVQSNASNIEMRTANKSMPPAGSVTALTQTQIKVIACWVEDGAKNN
jgi:hypothetical protein